ACAAAAGDARARNGRDDVSSGGRIVTPEGIDQCLTDTVEVGLRMSRFEELVGGLGRVWIARACSGAPRAEVGPCVSEVVPFGGVASAVRTASSHRAAPAPRAQRSGSTGAARCLELHVAPAL